MGGRSSKKTFTEWDLIKYSNMTNIPLITVENIYKDFMKATGNTNKMDKNEFRRLYKQMYISQQSNNTVVSFLTDQDLNKMSDHIFEIYDYDASDASKFGYCYLSLLSNAIHIHNRLLGIGANAMVSNCLLNNDETNEYVLKISNKSVDKEVSISRELYCDRYKIIKMHEYAFPYRKSYLIGAANRTNKTE
ncbi:unnamed protein product, partial [Rotaria sp. Silwood1]